VLEALDAYLEEDRDARGPIAEQSFAEVPLSAEQAAAAGDRLWLDMVDFVRATRQAEHDARVITLGELRLRYDFTVFGEAPADGRSLYLSLHGGGNAEPSVNDSQWENQKQLYQPEEGIYLSPRAPTDTWNLWHEDHIDPMFERLITNLIVLEGVNPDRVYVMGYSAGGDGVYQLGPRMADHWAAAAAMAGHPNESRPLSLRNIGFTIHVGELDTAYDRNLVAQEWSDQLDALADADPGGYPHVVEVHAGKPHWMDLEDAVAVPWMAEFTRNPVPTQIVWYQDDSVHERFYWLAVDEPVRETTVRATTNAQQIDINSDDVASVRVRLRDDLLDLDLPVTIRFNGGEVFGGIVPRTIGVLAATLEERGDPRMMFSGEVPALP
jgi:poly(3-hydroxybutyrate) depolymerase